MTKQTAANATGVDQNGTDGIASLVQAMNTAETANINDNDNSERSNA